MQGGGTYEFLRELILTSVFTHRTYDINILNIGTYILESFWEAFVANLRFGLDVFDVFDVFDFIWSSFFDV